MDAWSIPDPIWLCEILPQILDFGSLVSLMRTCRRMDALCNDKMFWHSWWKVIVASLIDLDASCPETIHPEFEDKRKDACLSIVTERCFYCRQRTMCIFRIIPAFVCTLCRRSLSLTTTTEARNEWFLKAHELSEIRYATRGGLADKLRWFLTSDVERLAKNKYGDDLDAKRERRKKRRAASLSRKSLLEKMRRDSLAAEIHFAITQLSRPFE